jgi:hypothetical protein
MSDFDVVADCNVRYVNLDLIARAGRYIVRAQCRWPYPAQTKGDLPFGIAGGHMSTADPRRDRIRAVLITSSQGN